MGKRKAPAPVIPANESDHYRILMRGGTADALLMILISTITIIFPLLLLRSGTIYYSSTPFYFTIVILFCAIMYLRYWGIFIAAITLVVSGLFLDLPDNVYVFNTLANILQVCLLLGSFLLLKKGRKKQSKGSEDLEEKMLYKKGEFYFSLYNLLIIGILLFYLGLGIFNKGEVKPYLTWLSAALFILTVCKSIRNSDTTLFKYTILIAFLPSAICSTLCAVLCKVPSEYFLDYCTTWTLSNYIFLQTIGYIFFQLFYVREVKPFKIREIIEVNVGTIAFYLAVLLINTLIIYLIYIDLLGNYGFLYFFPWILGNIFLLYNMFFTVYDDANGKGDDDDRFKWYEDRIITIEKNTSGIIMIIAFMLPLSVTLMKEEFPGILVILFAANIFFACLAVGLIWVPNRKIRFINLLKTIKTISYTYAITLLLTSSIMIMIHLYQMTSGAE